ncbi:protein of unknown function [Azospirillum baldaniorum]|uniref:Uncharacterized protein n=1 Tax=Azospirillum baldaniorum TaxID=1064539 RepID=A0A9P1NMU8_9PROT|nr:protein of unknown function [Azospirillum baldaniorum]
MQDQFLIVDDQGQRAGTVQGRHGAFRPIGIPGSVQGNLHRKACAPPRTRPHADRQAEQMRQPLHHRQPKAEAAAAVAFGVAELDELLENLIELVGGDADARVRHLDAQHHAAPPAAQKHPARRRVAHRVVEQVAQQPFQQDGVAADLRLERAHPQLQPLGGRARAIVGFQPLHHLGHREGRHVGRHDPGVEPGHVQQRVEQAAHRLDRPVHRLDQGQLRMVGQPLRQDRTEQGQRLGGLAQVVAGGGQEPHFGLAGARHLVPRGAQGLLLYTQPCLHAHAAAGVRRGHDDARGLATGFRRQRRQRDVEPVSITRQGQFLHQPPARGGHRLGEALRRVLPAAPDERAGHGLPDQQILRASDGAQHRRVEIGNASLPIEQGDRHADRVENPPQSGGVGGTTVVPRHILLSHRLPPSDCKPADHSAPTIGQRKQSVAIQKIRARGRRFQATRLKRIDCSSL